MQTTEIRGLNADMDKVIRSLDALTDQLRVSNLIKVAELMHQQTSITSQRNYEEFLLNTFGELTKDSRLT